MARVQIAEQAKADLEDVWQFIGVIRQSPTAAHRQVETLHDKFALLANHPLLGEACDHLRLGLRFFTAGSYVIYYTPRDDGIEVERVLHGARDVSSLF